MSLVPQGAARLSNAVLRVGGIPVGVRLEDGTAWRYHTLTGWWSAAPKRDRMEPRPTAGGAHDADPLPDARVIVVEGTISSQSRGVAAAGLDALAAVSGDVLFEVDDPDVGYRWAQCRVIGSPQEDSSGLGVGFVRWQLQLKAADWRKYGPTQSMATGLRDPGSGGLEFPLSFPLSFGTPPSGGRVTLVNHGNAPSEPRFAVSGFWPFQVAHVESAQRLTYANYGAVDLDCHEGTATADGQDRTYYLTEREWFSVPARQSATFAFSNLLGVADPDALMVASLAPAYW